MLKRPLLLLVALLGLCPRPGSAATTLIYDNDGVTSNGITDGTSAGWNTSATVFYNGTSDVAWSNANNDIAQFGGGVSGTAGALTVGTVTAGGLIFEAASSGSYSLTGGTITLAGPTPTLTANVSAAIASTLAGTAGFTKAGAGTLTLAGNSTGLTGTINLNAGTVSVVDTTTTSGTLIKALGATANPLSLNGGTLQVLANGDGASTAQTLTFGGYNTTVTADSTIVVDRASGTTAANKTIAFGNLSIGASALTISNSNGYGVRFSTLTLTGNATFNVANSSVGLTFNNVTGGTNSITKTGAGSLVINAGNFGDLNINAGNVDFNGTGTMSTVTVSGTSTWTSHSGDNWTMNAMVYNSSSTGSNFNAVSADSTYTIGTGGLSMSGGAISVNASNAGVTTKVILKGNVSITGTASLTSGGSGNRLFDLDGGTRTFTISSGATFTLAPLVQNGGIIKEGAGILKLTAANTYAGGNVVNAGTLQVTGSGTLGATTGDLTVNTGGTLDLAATSQTVANFNGTGGNVTNSIASPARLTVSAGTFAGTITNGTGTVALTKNDAGTLSLTSSATGSNSYTGGTLLNGGTLLGTDTTAYSGSPTTNKLFGTGTITLADGTTLQVRADGDGTATAQTLSYGNNLVVNGNVTLDANRNVSTVAKTKTIAFGSLSLGANTLTVLGGNSYVLRVGAVTLSGNATLNVGTGASFTLNSAVSGGTNSITKEGAGTVTMNGGGTYGDLIINAGIVDIFSNSTNQNITVNGSGAFSTHSGNTWSLNSLTYNSTATSNFTALSNDSTYTIGTGGLTMSKGTIQFTTNLAGTTDKLVLKGDVTITGTSSIIRDANAGTALVDFNGETRSFNVSSGATFTIAPVLQNGALTKTGAGVMAISGANIYTGGTTLSQGTLLASNITGSATGTGAVSVTGGVLGGTGFIVPGAGNSVTLSGTGSLNPGAATGDVSGTLTLSGNLVMDASAGGTPSIRMDIDGKAAGQFDRLVGIGTITLDGTINVVFASGYTGSTLTAGTVFDLFDWTTVDSTNFNVSTQLVLPNITSLGLNWDTSHFLDQGTAGGVISVVTFVPEPSRALLLALSLGMLALRRRR